MAYCTSTDVEAVVGLKALTELSNDTAGSTSQDNVILSSCIVKSDTLIDSIIAMTYALPLTAVHPILTNIAVDLTIYRLMLRRFSIMDMPKQWLDAKTDAMNLLDKIRALQIPLTGETRIIGGIADGDVVVETEGV